MNYASPVVTIPGDIGVTRGIVYKPRTSTKRIIVHDSHTTPDVEKGSEVLYWQGRLMGLLDVGYHFIIERDGRGVMTRDHTLIGTHTPGHNLDSIGICLIGGEGAGGLQEDNFTDAQRDRLVLIATWCLLRYDLKVSTVLGHTEIARYVDRRIVCPNIDMDGLRTDLTLSLDMLGPWPRVDGIATQPPLEINDVLAPRR